jgi:hypothetical protein
LIVNHQSRATDSRLAAGKFTPESGRMLFPSGRSVGIIEP